MGSMSWKMLTMIRFTIAVTLAVNLTNGQDITLPRKSDGTPKMVFSRALASAICEQQKLFVEKEAVQEPLKDRTKWRYSILPPEDGKCYDVRWNVCPEATSATNESAICYPFQSVDCKIY